MPKDLIPSENCFSHLDQVLPTTIIAGRLSQAEVSRLGHGSGAPKDLMPYKLFSSSRSGSFSYKLRLRLPLPMDFPPRVAM